MNQRTNELTHQRTIIIGAGIAGLTAAWRLRQAGIPVTILEQSSQVGGCIRTVDEGGYLLELGPNTFLNSSSALWELAESIGLKELKITTPLETGKKRYIFKKKRIYAVPSGPAILLSRILSIRGRIRLLKEPFIRPRAYERTRIPARRAGGRGYEPDESLANFVRRRFGREVLETLVTPFVSGIYAGDPEQLGVKAIFPKLTEIEERYGSIFKGMKALKGDIKSSGLGSFRAGAVTLPSAIESRLGKNIIKNARVTAIRWLNNAYDISYEESGEQKHLLTRTVICATPAYVTAEILEGVNDSFKKLLGKIEYAPIVVVHTGYKKADVPRRLDGFGFLVPRKNRVRMLGCLWSSALFQNRAPEGYCLLTNFLGGMLDREAIDLTNEDVMRVVQTDLLRALKIKSPPSFACITRYTHAIAQYDTEHTQRLAKINEMLASYKGLFLTGSWLTGISVAATIENAEKTAKEVLWTLT